LAEGIGSSCPFEIQRDTVFATHLKNFGVKIKTKNRLIVLKISGAHLLIMLYHSSNLQTEVSTLSVIAITLRYVFALSYNILTLWRNVVASISYCSEHIGADIASDSCRSKLIDQRYRFSVFGSAFSNSPVSLCSELQNRF
jgi:hypothetical protein